MAAPLVGEGLSVGGVVTLAGIGLLVGLPPGQQIPGEPRLIGVAVVGDQPVQLPFEVAHRLLPIRIAQRLCQRQPAGAATGIVEEAVHGIGPGVDHLTTLVVVKVEDRRQCWALVGGAVCHVIQTPGKALAVGDVLCNPLGPPGSAV